MVLEGTTKARINPRPGMPSKPPVQDVLMKRSIACSAFSVGASANEMPLTSGAAADAKPARPRVSSTRAEAAKPFLVDFRFIFENPDSSC
jgi:hypothetical protein